MTLDLCQVFTTQTVAPPPHGRPPHPTCAPGWGRGRRVRGWKQDEPAARTAWGGRGSRQNPIPWTGLQDSEVRVRQRPHTNRPQKAQEGRVRAQSLGLLNGLWWARARTIRLMHPFHFLSPKGRQVGGRAEAHLGPSSRGLLAHARVRRRAGGARRRSDTRCHST